MKDYFKQQIKNLIFSIKKASLRSIHGSMTVESAVVLPLFLIFFINLSCSVEMIRVHSNFSLALWNVGGDLATYGALTTDYLRNIGGTGHEEVESDSEKNENNTVNNDESGVGEKLLKEVGDLVVSYTLIKNKIVDYLGEDYIDKSPIVDGCDGLHFYDSEIFTEDDKICIVLNYKTSTLIGLGEATQLRMSNCYYAHLWNGYNVGGDDSSTPTERIVFVTENSEVYHKSVSCTYLRLFIRQALYSNLSEERNNSGGRYQPCLLCVMGSPPTIVYVCDEGGKFHYSKDCYSLKRSFSAVALSSVKDDHRACSRCGGG